MSEFPCCPFCGGSQFGIGYDGQPAHTLYVVCESCGATGPRSKSRTGSGVACDPAGVEATDGWKQRVISGKLLDKIREAVEYDATHCELPESLVDVVLAAGYTILMDYGGSDES